jgi:hypothetical protein
MPSLNRRLKRIGKDGMRKLFEAGQHIGFDILPRHFYSEIPDLRQLKRDDGWKLPRSMAGIRGTEPGEQLGFVEACCKTRSTPRDASDEVYAHACQENGGGGYGRVEADFLASFICAKKPRRIVQVGCGVSTAVILGAAESAGFEPELICVEPFPTEFLRESARRGKIALVPERAQSVPLELLTDLGSDGLLFVDSSHAVMPGSEVNRLVLEVLPRLRTGNWVHFHDIYFPYDYQKGLLADELFFSNESVLLQSFLTNNPRYTIRASLSMLHHAAPEELRELLPSYSPASMEHGLQLTKGDYPTSIYLEVTE